MNSEHFAIISDLHSNLEAITAVLEDIRGQGIEDIYCLGDVIGYGPNPNELLGLTEKFKLTIIGNHDEAVLNGNGLQKFNPVAAKAALWTRDEISHPAVSKEKGAWNRECLKNMQRKAGKGVFLFTHGSATSNMEYIINYYKAIDTFDFMTQNKLKVCFIGHTHRPCIFTEGIFEMQPVIEGKTYKIEGKNMIVNVGSVGQPRDRNEKACYVIIKNNRFFYRRVKYDLEKTIKKIYGIDRLHNYLGNRLRRGGKVSKPNIPDKVRPFSPKSV